eukprot:evm.model.scf_278.3 EVM.evm.TU.scf_278.3   scf_278:82856-85646(-)
MGGRANLTSIPQELSGCSLGEGVNAGSECLDWKTHPFERFPYMATISNWGVDLPHCSGILVHPRYVLTVARCTDDLTDFPRVTFPANRADGQRPRRKVHNVVQKIFNRPGRWKPGPEPGHEVVLLKLETDYDAPLPILAQSLHGLDYCRPGSSPVVYLLRPGIELAAAPFDSVDPQVCKEHWESGNGKLCLTSPWSDVTHGALN